MQALHGASCSCLGSLGGHISLSPIQSGKGHPKEHLWVLCNLLTEPLVSLAVGTSHTWYCFSGLSCLHNSRSRALGCLSILFLSTSAANKSAHICIGVTQMGPLPAPPHLGVFTLQIPSAHSHTTTSPKLATAEVAVKEPKEVDGALFKMVSSMPPVKHVSSSG